MFLSGIADEAGKTIEDQIRAHQELGWSHIEIRNVDDTTLANAAEKEFEAIRVKIEEAGMQVSCFASRIANWARDIKSPLDDDIEELKASIPRMKAMNTPFIRTMTWANKSNVSEAEWRRDALARMKELVKIAEDGGVTLVHENCDGWAGLGPEQTLEMLGEIASPALKLVYDTGNPIAHQQDPWDFYSKVRDHIVYVHIKDGVRKDGEPRFLMCGDGDARVPETIEDLFARGYDGGLSIEPHIHAQVHLGTEGDPEEKYRTYCEYGRRLMALVEAARA